MTHLYIIVLLVKRSRKYTLGSHDYANTAELVFIIGASLNLPPPLPRGWELGDPVKTEDRTSAALFHEAHRNFAKGRKKASALAIYFSIFLSISI